jgi:hypothetical protein
VEYFSQLKEVAMRRRTLWTPTLAWLGAVTAAFLLAFASPSKTTLMGKVPSPATQRLGQPGQGSGRVLALVGFDRSQRGEIKSWVDGLRLCEEQAIPWIRMAVLRDPGDEAARRAAEQRLLQSHSARQSARMVPVFTDRDAFAREAGLSGRDHASVLVLDRDGQVLAKAEGQFDPARADALRHALLAPEAALP